MFSSISPKRLLVYLMLTGLIPILIAWFSFSSKLDQINAIQEQLWSLQEEGFSVERKQSTNTAIRSHYHDTDHFYIDKNLETLVFLEPEIESLQKMLNNPNFPDDENIKKRLEMLSGSENSMVFTEGVVQSTPVFQEVTETLAHSVEVNVNDIQHILCRVEGIQLNDCTPPPHRPQLIVLEFKIDKKNVSEKNEIFSLNLKLLKREFL